MATDFFERQSQARRNTVWLIGMFLLGTAAIVGTTFAVAAAATSYYTEYNSALNDSGQPYPWEIPLLAAGGSLALVSGGTLYKVAELRAGGGKLVAERLRGKRLVAEGADLGEQRLLNVVEEMAIASGVPVPPVYLMEEQGINAFAAGYAPGDAVLGVTRGAVEHLDREQLQGVIAHEFSHVLNGDMRMSIRLIGILHGILLMGLVGQTVLRSVAYSGNGRSRRRSGEGGSGILVILGIALALVVLGYVGTFIGGLIKAAVSRQREYLADASAVQFTRNPRGIAGALKQIGGWVRGSRIQAPAAAEASHLFFAQGVWEGFTDLMATHPPLPKRIHAIEPDWDGKFPAVEASAPSAAVAAGAAGLVGGTTRTAHDHSRDDEIDPQLVDDAVHQVGEPEEVHRRYAAALIAELPSEVKAAAREPFGARAVIYCLLLDARAEVRQKQVAALRQHADPGVLRAASQLQRAIAGVDPCARLPLVDMSLPALQGMSPNQFKAFSVCLDALIAADNNLALFEWTLGRIVDRHLEPEFGKRRQVVTLYYGLQRLGSECSMLLSTIAHVGHDRDAAAKAFATAVPMLPDVPLNLLGRDQCSLAKLREALDTLVRATAKQRGRVLDACAEVICADGRVKLAEAELLRGIADLLDCPVPPLVAGETVAPAAAFREGQA